MRKIRKNRKIFKAGFAGILLICILYGGISLDVQPVQQEGIQTFITMFLKAQVEKAYFQIPQYLSSQKMRISSDRAAEQLFLHFFPIYEYMLTQQEMMEAQTDDLMLLIELQEGTDEENRDIEESSMDYGEDAMHIDSEMMEEMKKENGLHNIETTEESSAEEDKESRGETEQKSNNFRETFVAAEYPAYSYDWSKEWDYEKLVTNFYAIDKSTVLKEEYLQPEEMLKQDLSVDRSANGPQILIYHTHSKEAFADSIEGDPDTTIVGAGERLAEILSQEYGFNVLHHKAEYDTERSEAYAVALPEIEALLKENPSIEVVIDLHRDEMTGDRRLVMDLQGRPTARFMFFNGMSYSKKNGAFTNLENPYIKENLAFSFQAQLAANEYYPGIARKIYLKAYRYNMHLMPKSMLIELGAQNNTVEEIMNACDPLAHILAIVLDEML